jgi:hypothetical protein
MKAYASPFSSLDILVALMAFCQQCYFGTDLALGVKTPQAIQILPPLLNHLLLHAMLLYNANKVCSLCCYSPNICIYYKNLCINKTLLDTFPHPALPLSELRLSAMTSNRTE